MIFAKSFIFEFTFEFIDLLDKKTKHYFSKKYKHLEFNNVFR